MYFIQATSGKATHNFSSKVAKCLAMAKYISFTLFLFITASTEVVVVHYQFLDMNFYSYERY